MTQTALGATVKRNVRSGVEGLAGGAVGALVGHAVGGVHGAEAGAALGSAAGMLHGSLKSTSNTLAKAKTGGSQVKVASILNKIYKMASLEKEAEVLPVKTLPSFFASKAGNTRKVRDLTKIAIEIKKQNKGKLHAKLGVPEGKKIPVTKIEEAKHSKSPDERKEANFALNARKWNHSKNAGFMDRQQAAAADAKVRATRQAGKTEQMQKLLDNPQGGNSKKLALGLGGAAATALLGAHLLRKKKKNGN